MFRGLILVSLAIATVSCGGGGDKGTAPAPAAVANVSVTAPSVSVGIGQTVQLAARLTDANGVVLGNLAITWSSSQPGVASVSGSGLVTGVSPGTTTVSATSEGKTGSLAITVVPTSVAAVSVTPVSGVVVTGGTLQLSATATDSNGATIPGQTVTWTSSDPSKVTVSASGVVTGLGSATAPQVTSVSPTAITPGATLTIAGANFSTASAGVTVSVDGISLQVTSASTTQILASVPPTFPCVSSGNATLAVANAIGTVTITASVGGRSATAAVTVGSTPATTPATVQIANQRSLAVGQVLLLGDPAQVACNELTGTAGRYLISVYNTSYPTDNSTPMSVSFELRGAGGLVGSTTAATVRGRSPAALPSRARPSNAALAFAKGVTRHATDGHAARLARQAAIVRPFLARMKAGGPRPSPDVAGTQAAATVIPQTVGATTTLKIDTAGVCDWTFATVKARVVYVGTKSIILEDTNAPLAGTMDSAYRTLGQTFDNTMFPILTTYFGNPFAFDDSLSHVGKITMLFSPLVNATATDLLGFVTSCDFVPAQDAGAPPSSNTTEMFYARVPITATGSTSDDNTLPGWRSVIGATLIHESKHITAIAERFANPVGDELEESWLEEGTAQMAVEFWARTVYGPPVGWKSNATYQQTVYDDYRDLTPYMMGDHFLFLYVYLQTNEMSSFLSPGWVDPDIYGSAWLFARWLVDQYSMHEFDLLKPLVKDATMSGIANVTDKAGRTWEELDGYFTLALAADDYPGFASPAGAAPPYVVPSWNLRSIFSGLAADFPPNIVPWPLSVHPEPFGAWTTPVTTLMGGSGSIFDLSGTQTGRQLLDLHALSGLALPAGHTLRMAIVRVQ